MIPIVTLAHLLACLLSILSPLAATLLLGPSLGNPFFIPHQESQRLRLPIPLDSMELLSAALACPAKRNSVLAGPVCGVIRQAAPAPRDSGLLEIRHQQTLFPSAHLPHQAKTGAEAELVLPLGGQGDLQKPPTEGNPVQVKHRNSYLAPEHILHLCPQPEQAEGWIGLVAALRSTAIALSGRLSCGGKSPFVPY